MALNSQALWLDNKKNSIYCFGGDSSRAKNYGIEAPLESIWSFFPDGKGAGSWKEVLGPTVGKPFPPEILRRTSGAVSSDESHGYYLGGWANNYTSRSLTTEMFRPTLGLLTLNFSDLTLKTTSDGGDGSGLMANRRHTSGQMVNLPDYGPGGVLILLGGGMSSNLLAFNNITIYDKAQQKFMYGGVIDYRVGPKAENSDQVYILSIPAFQWFQANYPPAHSRAIHTCHSTKTNQMIIIGGVDPTHDITWVGDADWEDEPRDPWAEGIGVFDMTALKFKDSYEANTKPYEPPEMIQSFYNDKSKRYPATWTSSAVRELFQKGFKSNQAPNTTDSQVPKPINSSTAPPHISSAVIAGLVASGLVASGLLCAIAIFIVRKRTRKIRVIPHIIRGELPTTQSPDELPALIEPTEFLDHHKDRTELANSGIAELFQMSIQERVELP
ncbi:hypothetical protein MMC31_004619 [Peltigera leucophlebia]|nr:hypothetical protein [Peltigera leucophlebia]